MRGRAKRAGWRGGRRVRRARSAAVGVRPPRSAPGISPPALSVRFLQCLVHTPRLLGTPPSCAAGPNEIVAAAREPPLRPPAGRRQGAPPAVHQSSSPPPGTALSSSTPLADRNCRRLRPHQARRRRSGWCSPGLAYKRLLQAWLWNRRWSNRRTAHPGNCSGTRPVRRFRRFRPWANMCHLRLRSRLNRNRWCILRHSDTRPRPRPLGSQ